MELHSNRNTKQPHPEKQCKPVDDDPGSDLDNSLAPVKQIGKVLLLKVPLQIDGCNFYMEIFMSEGTDKRLWPTKDLIVSEVKLQTHTKKLLSIVGTKTVHV